jgi:surfactin synthase thioesterase subunit
MTTTTTADWVRRFSPDPGAPVRLACLPHAGGSATFFYPLAAALTPGVEVLAVQYPGHQDRYKEPCLENMNDLVDGVLAALWPWTDRPLALLGHSMGATIGFEVTRRLEEAGVVPAALFVSGRRGPTPEAPGYAGPLDDGSIIAELESTDGFDARVFADDELLAMVMPAIRGDYRALGGYRYRPGPRLRCPVVVLTGDSDPKVSVDQASGWSDVAGETFALRVLPGGHFFVREQTAEVAAVVSRTLGGG